MFLEVVEKLESCWRRVVQSLRGWRFSGIHMGSMGSWVILRGPKGFWVVLSGSAGLKGPVQVLSRSWGALSGPKGSKAHFEGSWLCSEGFWTVHEGFWVFMSVLRGYLWSWGVLRGLLFVKSGCLYHLMGFLEDGAKSRGWRKTDY